MPPISQRRDPFPQQCAAHGPAGTLLWPPRKPTSRLPRGGPENTECIISVYLFFGPAGTLLWQPRREWRRDTSEHSMVAYSPYKYHRFCRAFS